MLDEDEKKVRDSNKLPKIFISHSSKDAKHVELIVRLLKDMGFNRDKVFCSSIPGYGIHLNNDIIDTLRDLFNHNNLYVIFVHSPNYYGSAVCLNEMGAAWALKTSFCSFLLPGFNYTDMKGVVKSSRIAIKIDSDRNSVRNLLNELYEDLSGFFSTNMDNSIVWEKDRDDFIEKMNEVKVFTDSAMEDLTREILPNDYEIEKNDDFEDVTKFFNDQYVQIKSSVVDRFALVKKDNDQMPVCFCAENQDKGERFQVTLDNEGWASFKASNDCYWSVYSEVTEENLSKDQKMIRSVTAFVHHKYLYEKFKIYKTGCGYAILARYNGTWLTCHKDEANHPLYAFQYDAGSWEKFDISITGDRK